MPYPAALQISTRPAPASDAATVVFVHGSLDRGDSFRRVMRRLPELSRVAYDRRGYQGSRGAGVTDLDGHIEDLLALAEELRATTAGPVVAVGHSFGGDVVVGAGLASRRAFDAIGAFEPPMPWLGFRRRPAVEGEAQGWPPMSEDPAVEVEHFFSRMVSPEAWSRLTEEGRADRVADGPALMGDLRSFRWRPSSGAAARARPPTIDAAWSGWARTCRVRPCSALRGRSTVRTSLIRIISPP
jgi:pimeloyl-ACP methyl ester carboxylesterase